MCAHLTIHKRSIVLIDPKWRSFWHYVISLLLLDLMLCQIVPQTGCRYVDWAMDNPFVGPSGMTFCRTNYWTLCNVIRQNVIWDQKTESFVYHWLCLHLMFNDTCFPAFVGALDAFLELCGYVISQLYLNAVEYWAVEGSNLRAAKHWRTQ